jgi:alpha-glucosidase
VTLLVCLDAQGEARGTLYEDAGDGYGYERGMYRLTTFQVSQRAGRVSLATSYEGNWPEPDGRTVELVVVPPAR